MTDQPKTPEEMRMDMYKQLREQQGAGEHLCEVAMPGVYRPVKDSDIEH